MKLKVTEVDHDFGLHSEDLTSAAVHPPVRSLKLENHQGYPQIISVEASSDDEGVGATVEDVLLTIHEDLGMPFPESSSSNSDIEKELGIGQHRIESLGGRDRLQILPKGSPDDSVLLSTGKLLSAASVSC